MNFKIGTIHEMNVDYLSIASFYKEHWPNRTALINNKFYNWQFKSSPAFPDIDNCVILYDISNKQLAGVMGLNAKPFYLNNTWKKAAELTTWIIAAQYRGQGLGGKVIDYIQENYDIILGMGVSEFALPIYMTRGLRYLHAIPRFVKIFDIEALTTISKYNLLAKKLANKWSSFPKLDYKITEKIDSNYNPLFERIKNNYNLSIRDLEHIKWRYENHPVFTYKTFLITHPTEDKAAFVCLREETSIENVRLLHVLDCIGDDEAIPLALSFIEQFGMENDFHAADFFCTAAKINKFLLSSGWFSIMDDFCFQLPHLFHPVEFRIPPTTSFIYWSKENFVDMCDFSRLYISKQDVDFDRPII